MNPVTALILLSSRASYPEGQGLPVPGAGHSEAFTGMGGAGRDSRLHHTPHFTLLVDRAWPIWGLISSTWGSQGQKNEPIFRSVVTIMKC